MYPIEFSQVLSLEPKVMADISVAIFRIQTLIGKFTRSCNKILGESLAQFLPLIHRFLTFIITDTPILHNPLFGLGVTRSQTFLEVQSGIILNRYINYWVNIASASTIATIRTEFIIRRWRRIFALTKNHW